MYRAADAIEALYGAFAALARARAVRGALELDLREDRVVLDADRRPRRGRPRTRLDSHRLIEEFMILANVAAAEELETRHQACMYRIHDAPDPAKIAVLRDFLEEIGIPGLAFAKGQAVKPELFNRLLRRADGTPIAPLVNELVLRCQAQAAYSPNNIGHFGLALRRYAHFTSPIGAMPIFWFIARSSRAPMRQATILALVACPRHRSRANGSDRRAHLSDRTARHRGRARALDRYRAALLAGAVGIFFGQITGVAAFGLFVTLSDSGTKGLIPISTLPADYDVGARSRRASSAAATAASFPLGAAVTVRLVEADAIGGRLVFRVERRGAMRGFRGSRQG